MSQETLDKTVMPENDAAAAATDNGAAVNGSAAADTGPEAPPPPPARRKISGEAKLFIGIMVGAVVLVSATFIPMMVHGTPGKPPPPPPPAPVKWTRDTLVPPGSHLEGDPKAPFTLVEFADFECSHCAAARPDVRHELDTHKGKLNVVYRHFRAVPNHLISDTLAYGAEAAGKQGKFFPMVDAIFAHQQQLEGADDDSAKEALMHMASDLGLDINRFKADMDGDAVRLAWQRDNEAAGKLGIEGTPTFFFIPPKGKVIILTTREYMTQWLNSPKSWQ